MKNEISITVRAFPVLAHDHRTGDEACITVTVTKDQLRAAHIVGESSMELIERMAEKQGYSVIEIGTPDKLTFTVDLDKLLEQHEEQVKWNLLYGGGEGAKN